MSLLHTSGRGARDADANMDEILSSIRRIIDEEPIGPRHRFQVPQQRAIARTVDTTTVPTPVVVARPPSAVTRAPAEDEILAELLEPAAGTSDAEFEPAEAKPQSPPEADTEQPTKVLAVVEGPAPLLPAPNAQPIDEGAPAPAAVAQPPKPEATPDDGLAQFAAGLNALLALPTVTQDAIPAATVSTTDSDAVAVKDEPSPAEAAAAALAAVAAVNAAAAQAGQRGSAEPPAIDHTDGEALSRVEPPSIAATAEPVEASVGATVSVAEPTAPVRVAAIDAPLPATPADGQTQALVPQPPVSFEDAISAMLRPLLREWLDANLPRMVEKALKEEVAAHLAK
jgi:cell pole-organizing protein PopZ